MDYKEVTLYGRKIRVYSENHIEMEYRGKAGDWQVKPILSRGFYTCINFMVNNKSRNILLHRLVFYAHNPSWHILDTSRDNVIDHRNGKPLDNRIENLQCVTHQENEFNKHATKGYSWNKARKKWKAHIGINGKAIHLGYFVEESDARDAYLLAKSKYHIIQERVFD